MTKFKICPYCGEKNDPSLTDCINCGEDISAVPLTTEEALQKEKERREADNAKADNFGKEETALPVLVRICECGAENPAAARKCRVCGEDISDILPVRKGEKKPLYTLTSADGRYCYALTKESCIIGRENEMGEYLAPKTYVGRRHCLLTVENGELYITDLNSTNHSFVNGRRIREKTKLRKGDEISLGGDRFSGAREAKAAYFVID